MHRTKSMITPVGCHSSSLSDESSPSAFTVLRLWEAGSPRRHASIVRGPSDHHSRGEFPSAMRRRRASPCRRPSNSPPWFCSLAQSATRNARAAPAELGASRIRSSHVRWSDFRWSPDRAGSIVTIKDRPVLRGHERHGTDHTVRQPVLNRESSQVFALLNVSCVSGARCPRPRRFLPGESMGASSTHRAIR